MLVAVEKVFLFLLGFHPSRWMWSILQFNNDTKGFIQHPKQLSTHIFCKKNHWWDFDMSKNFSQRLETHLNIIMWKCVVFSREKERKNVGKTLLVCSLERRCTESERKEVYVQVNGNESNVKRAHSRRHKLTTLAAELCYFMKLSECWEIFYWMFSGYLNVTERKQESREKQLLSYFV